MPCIRNDNGKPVFGAQGQCPIGSSWMPESQQLTDLTAADKDIMQNAEKGTGIFGQDVFGAGGVDIGPSTLKTIGTTAIGAAAGAPLIRGGINMLKDNKSAIGNKMKDLFGKLIMKQSKEYPKQAQKSYAWYMGLKGVDKIKALSLAGAGLGLQQLMSAMGADDTVTKGELSEKQKTLMADGPEGRRGRATLNPQETSRSGGTFEQTSMQKLGDNMKDPKWWTESISGLPSDTRLMRMGQLMDYYGKKPKGREASTAPSKLWAENEAAAQAAQAKVLAAGSTPPDAYKWSYGDTNKALDGWYDDKFGTDYPFGKDGKALKATFMNDVTDEKRRYPGKNLEEIAEALLLNFPNKYI
tara:strand:+ start:435 stop:1499 length:1065 start_codon:yes stop_codon:yes gene_type:complete